MMAVSGAIGCQCKNCGWAEQPSSELSCPECGSLDLHFYPLDGHKGARCLCGHQDFEHKSHPHVIGSMCVGSQECRCREFREAGGEQE